MPALTANGLTLAYDVQGRGQPLVLIAGIGYGRWFWNRLVPLLAERYQVVTFDNRGAGSSAKPAGPYTTPLLAADTLGLIDSLGLQSIYLLGHSLGGFVAQEMALARPDLVSKLVLASTTFGGPRVIPPAPEVLQLFTDRSGDPVELVRRGLALAAAPGAFERQPELFDELLAYRLTNPVPPPQYTAQVMAGLQHNAEARLASLRCPTLVLFGAEDRVVPPGNAELLAHAIPGAQVQVLTGLGHIFAVEDPQATARAILDFLG